MRPPRTTPTARWLAITLAMLEFVRGHLDLGDDRYRVTRSSRNADNAWTVSGVRSGHVVVTVTSSGLPAPIAAPPTLYDGILQPTS